MFLRHEILNLRLTCQVEDAVTGADVGQEGVSQALARVGTFHQASYVHHIKEWRDFAANQEVEGERIAYWEFIQKVESALVVLQSSMKTLDSLFNFGFSN